MEVTVPDGSFGIPDGLKAWLRQAVTDGVAPDGGTVVSYFAISAFQDPPVVPQPPDGF